MKIKEIRESTVEELQTRRRDLRQEQFHLRLQQQAGQLEKPSQIHLLRKEVARIETILSERRLKAAPAPVPKAAPKAPTPKAAKKTAKPAPASKAAKAAATK